MAFWKEVELGQINPVLFTDRLIATRQELADGKSEPNFDKQLRVEQKVQGKRASEQ